MGRSLAPDTPCSLSSPPLCLCWLAPSHRAGPQAPRSPGTRAWGAGGLHPGAAQEAEGDERGVSSRPRCGLGLVGRATGWQPVQHRGGVLEILHHLTKSPPVGPTCSVPSRHPIREGLTPEARVLPLPSAPLDAPRLDLQLSGPPPGTDGAWPGPRRASTCSPPLWGPQPAGDALWSGSPGGAAEPSPSCVGRTVGVRWGL